jgi:hypothetical protein
MYLLFTHTVWWYVWHDEDLLSVLNCLLTKFLSLDPSQEDLTPKRVVELVQELRQGKTPKVSSSYHGVTPLFASDCEAHSLVQAMQNFLKCI